MRRRGGLGNEVIKRLGLLLRKHSFFKKLKCGMFKSIAVFVTQYTDIRTPSVIK